MKNVWVSFFFIFYLSWCQTVPVESTETFSHQKESFTIRFTVANDTLTALLYLFPMKKL